MNERQERRQASSDRPRLQRGAGHFIRRLSLVLGRAPWLRSARRLTGRDAAWRLAAVTGTIGIVLLLLMQISEAVSRKSAADDAQHVNDRRHRDAASDVTIAGPASTGASFAAPSPAPATTAERETEAATPWLSAQDDESADPWLEESRETGEPPPWMEDRLRADEPNLYEPFPPPPEPIFDIHLDRFVHDESELTEHSRAAASLTLAERHVASGAFDDGWLAFHPLGRGSAGGPADAEDAAEPVLVQDSADAGSSTLIVAPRLRIEVDAPQSVVAGRPANFTVRIVNEGRVDAANVVLTHSLAADAHHTAGRTIERVVGTIAAGRTYQTAFTLVADVPGEQTHTTMVAIDGEPAATAATKLAVARPPLVLRRRGLKSLAVGEAVLFTNHVINRGESDVLDVEVVESVPGVLDVLQVGDGGRFDANRREIRWRVDRLSAGETVLLNVTLRPRASGSWRSMVRADDGRFVRETMQATIHVTDADEAAAGPPGVFTAWSR